jgi:hypothetical protein
MANMSDVTCTDCYFRRSGLCALASDEPCPTFRADVRSSLASVRPPRLVPRQLAAVTVAPQHAAA